MPLDVNSPEVQRYIEWRCTPRALRSPQHLTELGEELGLAPRTIYSWKYKEHIEAEINKKLKFLLKDSLADLYNAIIKHSVDGNAQYAKMLLDIVNDQYNKQTLVVEEKKTLDEDEVNNKIKSLLQKYNLG